MQNLKIAIFLHASSLGGAERSHVELVKELEDAGHHTISVIPAPDMGLNRILSELGVRVLSIEGLTWWTSKHADEQVLIREVEELKELLLGIKPNLVITQSAVIVQPLIASFFLNIPHVQFLREFIDLDFGMHVPFGQKCFGDLYEHLSGLVVCNSFAVRNYFYPEEGHKKVIVMRPFPTVTVKRKEFSASDTFTFGLVGALLPTKGHWKVVEAVESLSEQVRSRIRVKFFFHAMNVDFRDQLKKRISQSGLTHIFSFEGERVSLDEIYSEFQCLISASQYEAFGRTPIEAMAFGVPSIYSKTGGIAEYMRDNVDGIEIDVDNPNELCAAMTRMALDNTFFLSIRDKVAERYIELGLSPDYRQFPELLRNVITSRDHPDSVRISSLFFGIQHQSNSLVRQRDDLILQRNDLVRQRDDLIEDRRRLTREISEIYSSEFWSVTKPIRWLIGIVSVLLRKIRNKG